MTVENISLDVKTNAGSAAKQVRSLSSALSSVRSAGKSVASGGTHKAVSRVGNAAKTATKHTNKFFASIKRIAGYRLLRTMLKEITQGFQEGLKHAYAFSRGITGSLAQALDHLASVSGQMKNQMGAAFGELLQTIMPIIEAIAAAITRLMTALSALFAALGGRAQYLSAGEDEATAWDKASGAASKYKKTILGFDEINRLNDKNKGGGGGADSNVGKWELADLPDWAEKVRQSIEDGNWSAAGSALAEHINDVFDDWNSEKAGKKLGEKINKAINFAFGFTNGIVPSKIGQKIAGFLNGAFGEINFETLGSTLVGVFTGAFDGLIGFVSNLDTYEIGNAIKNFIVGGLNRASDWMDDKDFKSIGKTVSDKIIKFFDGLDPKELAKSIGRFISTALEKAKDFLSGVDWEAIGKKVTEWFITLFSNIDWDDLASKALGFLGEAMGAVGGFLGGVAEGALSKEIEGVVQEITMILSDASLVLGAILLFSGHIPLGLGLLIAGLAGKDEAEADWDKVPDKTKGIIAVIEEAAGAALLALGAVLLFSGASIPLGLGLLAAGGAVLATQKKEDWEFVSDEVKGKIAAIELAAGAALIALGLILAFSGAGIGLGLGMIVAGGAVLATAAKEDWTKVSSEIQTTLAVIGAVTGIALMAVGIMLLLTGAGIGLGLGCILAASAVLGATAASFSIDGTKNDLTSAMDEVGVNGENNFGKIAKAIDGVVTAVSNLINWFSTLKTRIGEVNTGLNNIEQHKTMYGDVWGEVVRGSELGLYASGGAIENNGSLFVAGEAGPEIVANMGNRTGVMNVEQMEAAVANGNIGVINAIYGMANAIVNAVESIDPDITLDGQSLADKMYHYNQQAANRYGAAMVT